MTSCCIVVVGHVDHGKTALVRTLTGQDTDRLPEEKARGLSITNGFAHRRFSNGTIDFIDAPGHEDFIQAMVAGATGAQAALLVISATELIQAQTYEHLAVIDLLGITEGVIAVTKADLLSASEHARCRATLRAGLAGTVLAKAPMIICSALRGDSIEHLDTALQQLIECPRPQGPPAAMLPIDRVFSIPGRGTIVTGTLLGADLTADTDVTLEPAGRAVTLRGLQSRGDACDTLTAGARVAVNLRGASVAGITRGDVLCARDTAQASTCLDVRIITLPNLSKPLKHMEKVRVLLGTGHEVATLHLFQGPQTTSLAQLRFARPVCAYEGQRAVLRRLSPPETIAGAEVLDTQATPARGGSTLRQAMLLAILSRSALTIADTLCSLNARVAHVPDIARLSRLSGSAALDGLGEQFEMLGPGVVARKSDILAAQHALVQVLKTHHETYPLRAAAPPALAVLPGTSDVLTGYVLGVLRDAGQIQMQAAGVSLSGHDPVALLSAVQRAEMAAIDTAFATAGLSVPDDPHAASDLVGLLVDIGRIVPLQNIALNQILRVHCDCLMAAAHTLQASFPPPARFTTSQARTALSTSRKFVVPVLEYFDKCGVTSRANDLRQVTGIIPVSPSYPA